MIKNGVMIFINGSVELNWDFIHSKCLSALHGQSTLDFVLSLLGGNGAGATAWEPECVGVETLAIAIQSD